MGPAGKALVGRTSELDRLTTSLTPDHGQGRVVVVEGEAGVGKSALVAEAAAATELTVLAGRGDELEQGRPFHLFRSMLGLLPEPVGGRRDAKPATDAAAGRPSDLHDLLDLPGPQGDLSSVHPSAWSRAADAVLAVVEERARQPVLVVAEDLHWADVQSLRLLHHVAALSADRPLSLVATTRPTDIAEVAVLIDRLMANGAALIRLQPLRGDDIAALVEAELGAAPGLRLRTMAQRSGGNPLILSQLIAGLVADDSLDRHAGTVELSRTAETPATLRAAVRRRLSALEPGCAELLRIAAVVGSRFSIGELGLLMGKSAVTMTEAIRQAVDSGLVVDAGSELAFQHDLVRDAVYHDLPSALRRELHRELAAARRAAGEPTIRVAEHLAFGLEQGDDDGIGEVRAAVASIAYRAPRVALALLDRAASAAGDRRDLIDVDRIEPRAWLGDIDGAAEDAARLLDAGSVPVDRRASVRSTLAGLRVLQRRTDDALQQFRLALAECDDDRLRSRLGAQSAMAHMSAGDFAGAAREARWARALAVDVEESGSHAMAAGLLGRILTYGNDWTAGLELVREAVEVAERDPASDASRFIPWFFCGTTHLEMGHYERARVLLARGSDRALEHETEWAHPLYHTLAAATAWRTGAWDEALVEARSSHLAAADTGAVVAEAWAYGVEAHIHLARDDIATARTLVDRAGALVTEGEALLGIDVYSLAAALVTEAEGRTDDAAVELGVAWDLLDAGGVPSSITVLGVDLVRLALDTDDQARAASVADRMAALASACPEPLFRAQAATAQACTNMAVDTCCGAVDAARELDAPSELFTALRIQARSAARRGDPSAAREARDEALRIAENLGATRWRAALLRELRGHGLGRAPRARPRPRFGWDALTPTEREIAELVAAGLTNAQIAAERRSSRRTVESHLVRLYRKLEVCTRTELAVLVAGRVDPD